MKGLKRPRGLPPRVITLTTDFGDSAYVGAMKGAILSIHPEARVVDVTHAVPAHDVVQGALALYAAAPYFPPGTIHVAVVDPGVGTERRPLLVEAEDAAFVGPDNGILVPAAERLGLKRVRLLENARYWRATVAPTFHGRDLFGPVAAHLDRGARFDDVGHVVDDHVRLDFGRPRPLPEGGAEGVVLAVDSFGNAITNLPAVALDARPGDDLAVHAGDARLRVRYARTYGEAPPGETLLLLGSSGFLEVATNRGSAARTFRLAVGDPVRVAPAR